MHPIRFGLSETGSPNSVLRKPVEGYLGLLQFGVVDRTCPLAGWRGRPVARASWWCGRL